MVRLVIRGPIQRADLPGLFDRVCTLFGSNRGSIVLCDVAGVDTDAITVEAIARLQLAARRHACQLRLCNVSEELLGLVAFLGLREALTGEALDVEPQRQSEQRKERLGFQEER
jgi:ABC-type transporter Mla MlaB component